MIGKIRRLIADRAFGFIAGNGRKDVFFHASQAADFDALTEGQQVEYEPVESPKGPQAQNVRAVSTEE